uniref:Uncharacterized protein n=1 Tax=Leersia perrieri TaxID=77586 RepID=A0A0D9W1Z2_9ORYZ
MQQRLKVTLPMPMGRNGDGGCGCGCGGGDSLHRRPVIILPSSAARTPLQHLDRGRQGCRAVPWRLLRLVGKAIEAVVTAAVDETLLFGRRWLHPWSLKDKSSHPPWNPQSKVGGDAPLKKRSYKEQ